MKNIIVAALSVAAVMATPALAGETRVEARGGVVWVPGASNEAIGLALGYDTDIGGNLFAGIEGTADTDFDFVSPVLGLNARLGFKASDNAKVFVTGGYAYDTDFDIDDIALGAGAQFAVGEKSFVSVQYQRYLDLEINRVSVGVGYKF